MGEGVGVGGSNGEKESERTDGGKMMEDESEIPGMGSGGAFGMGLGKPWSGTFCPLHLS